MSENIEIIIAELEKESEEKLFFSQQNLGAEIHWLFIQGFQALQKQLYIPACTSFLCGIEASLRITMSQIKVPSRVTNLNPRDLLSNKLIKAAYLNNLPVNTLAFPQENDFVDKFLNDSKRINVELVRVRHNLCHGNILEYVNTELGENYAFFTPECCKELAFQLYEISKRWTHALGKFRSENL